MRLPFSTWEEFHPGEHKMERNKRKGLIRKYAVSEEAQDRKELLTEGIIRRALAGEAKPEDLQVATGAAAHITMPDHGTPMNPFDPEKAVEALRAAATATDWTALIPEGTLIAPRHTLLPNIIKTRIERLDLDTQTQEHLASLLPKPLAHGDRNATTLATYEPSPDDFVADKDGVVRVTDWDSPIIGPLDVSLISLGTALRVEGRDVEARAVLQGVEDQSLVPWVSRCRMVLMAARSSAAGDSERSQAILELLEEQG